ncbi:MAG: carboxypeptidase-like regulatory domain-containing protein [Cyclobacteriaceae bacterium]|nr:carboxypeptidase-like regulatory domain-containing protein [Cyclobacteriaceae bacterium]
MKKSFVLTVPTPCHENWNAFTPTQKGKFCGTCRKEVIDFTTWTDAEIKQYFKAGKGSTCGRFAQHQLKTYRTETPAKARSAWAAIVAFLMLLIHEPAEAQTTPDPVHQEQVDEQKKGGFKVKALASITVKGIVMDDVDSLGLPGVNVVRKGTSEGTVTDAAGRFELTINHPSENETLVVSFIGLKTVELAISPNQDTHMKIMMTYDVNALLGEIVVGGAISVKRYSPRGLWWKLKNLFR